MIKCEVCGRSFKNVLSISMHIVRQHKITTEEYYRKFLMINFDENVCEMYGKIEGCYKNTRFVSIEKGYNCFCGNNKCITNNSKVREKVSETCLKNYGVKNPFQSEEVKEKYKNTCIEKYGVDSINKIDSVKKKKEKTCLKNYGVKNPNQSEKIKEKKRQTCLKNYGVLYPMQSKIVLQKSAETSLIKYGVVHPRKCKLVVDKQKKTCLEKYGVDNVSKVSFIIDKIRETFIRKYGVENASQVNEFKEKRRKTCLEKYGVEHYSKTKNWIDWMIREGSAYLNSFNTGGPSKPQLQLMELVKQIYPEAELDMTVPGRGFLIDIAIPSIMLAIEYDGSYWHQDKEYDKNRQNYIENLGWSFLRYEDCIPKIKDLKKDIEKVIEK